MMVLLKRLVAGALVCGCVLVAGCVTEVTDDATGKPKSKPSTERKVDMQSALADYITGQWLYAAKSRELACAPSKGFGN
ncbi:MAG: hypothetical protein R3E67_07495 [Pseudomonadales bacterium]